VLKLMANLRAPLSALVVIGLRREPMRVTRQPRDRRSSHARSRQWSDPTRLRPAQNVDQRKQVFAPSLASSSLRPALLSMATEKCTLLTIENLTPWGLRRGGSGARLDRWESQDGKVIASVSPRVRIKRVLHDGDWAVAVSGW